MDMNLQNNYTIECNKLQIKTGTAKAETTSEIACCCGKLNFIRRKDKQWMRCRQQKVTYLCACPLGSLTAAQFHHRRYSLYSEREASAARRLQISPMSRFLARFPDANCAAAAASKLADIVRHFAGLFIAALDYSTNLATDCGGVRTDLRADPDPQQCQDARTSRSQKN